MPAHFPSLESVQSVYNGKAHKCCCGCSGNHRYPSGSDAPGAGAAIRGYDISADEISDISIKKAYNKIKKAHEAGETEWLNNIYSIEDDRRLTIVYFKKVAA